MVLIISLLETYVKRISDVAQTNAALVTLPVFEACL
jgi:hypothetical protein